MNGIYLLPCTELLDTPCWRQGRLFYSVIREVTQTEPRLSTHNPEVTVVIADKLCPADLLFICLYGRGCTLFFCRTSQDDVIPLSSEGSVST